MLLELIGILLGTSSNSGSITYTYYDAATSATAVGIPFTSLNYKTVITPPTPLALKLKILIIDGDNPNQMMKLQKTYTGKSVTTVTVEVNGLNRLSVSDKSYEDIDTTMNLLVAYVGPTADVHIIGHGKGAHLAGRIGREMFDSSAPTKVVNRITGLNPTRMGLISGFFRPDLSLQTSDADFVDVIHTESVVVGTTSRLGDADFYPNGGIRQRSCSLLNPACSSEKAIEYFTESVVTPAKYQAVRCISNFEFERGNCDDNLKVSMGDAVPLTTKGTFYLNI